MCPVCKQNYLYVVQEHKHTYAVKSIGFHDVHPGEKVSAEARFYLTCFDCNWTGWIDEYFEAEHGVIKLFPEVPEYEDTDKDPNLKA